MKKILSIAALSMLSLSSLFTAPAQAAGTANGNFNVNLTLTSACQINTPTDLAMSYTALQGTAATGTSTINVKCTNTLPYTLALDSTSVLDAATNLTYTLALSGATAAGTGANQVITVTGNIASGQSGTCALASCTNAASGNKNRILTVTY